MLVLWDLLLPGYVLTLDMVFGPNIRIWDYIYGLEPSFNSFIAYKLFLKLCSFILPVWVIEKALMVLAFFLSGVSSHRLCPTESVAGKFFAGFLYMLNPFLYVRFMAGHLDLILAYALMPFVVKGIIRLLDSHRLRSTVELTFLLTLVGVLSLHTLLLALFALAVLLLVKLVSGFREISILRNLCVLSISFALLNIYWIAPSFTRLQEVAPQISYADLQVFTARNWGTEFNILFSLASMHGFWRGGYNYIFNILPLRLFS
ncbi:MAG: hypothetical protein QXJ75_04915 [Candidatus Bathyarchaeia archaeon]